MDSKTIIKDLRIKHSFKVTNKDGDVVTCTVGIDFAGCTLGELADWSVSTRIIAGQRVWRDMTVEELAANVDGGIFHARDIGRKIKTADEKKLDLIKLGLPEAEAEIYATDPEKFARIMAKATELLTLEIESDKNEIVKTDTEG